MADEPLTPLQELGREVARSQDRELASTEELAEARRGFLAAAAEPAPALSFGRSALLAGTTAVAALIAFLLMVLWPRPIEVRPGDAKGASSADFFAAQAEPLPLRFSEGSAVELAPFATARILSRTDHGVTLSLERGSLAVAVVHRKDTDWRLRAGPFEVRVTGTSFGLEWRSDQGSLALTNLRGAVVVSGCEPGQSLGLSTGQALHVTCRDGRLQEPPPPVTERPAEELHSLPAPDASALSAVVVPPPPAARPRAPQPEPLMTWQELAHAGRFTEAWTLARGAGLSPILANEDAPELLLLASSARYAGENLGAQQVLLTLRTRFPGTPQATVAAFDLGRLFFDDLGDFASAETWFATVLREEPEGPLAQDALGRLMEVRVRQGHRAAAEAAAREYLARFPGGPQAGLARSLVSP